MIAKSTWRELTADDDPEIPVPPDQNPGAPVREPPSKPTTEPDAPVREPGPEQPKRLAP